MGEEFKLAAMSRGEKEKVRELRRQSFVPAVIYGPGAKNYNLKMREADFIKVFTEAGETNLINLTVDKAKPVKVVVYEVDKDPVKDKIMHVDFYQVDMAKKITVEIPLNFVGESRAVRELGGVLVKNAASVKVECLPDKLVNQLEVDLSKLDNLEDSFKMSDLKLPAGIELTSQTDEILAIAVEQKVEEEVKPVEAEAAPVEGEEKKEAEAAVPVEGEEKKA